MEVIDLRNKDRIHPNTKNKAPISQPVSKRDHIPDKNLGKISESKKQPIAKQKNLSGIQWVFVIYIVILLLSILGIYIPNWGSIWQLPKSIVLILGTIVLLFIVSMAWIFGRVKHTVQFTLLDICMIWLGIGMGIISFLHPSQIAFWGSTSRIFDAGIFWVCLILFYLIIKIFVEAQSLRIIGIMLGYLLFLGSLVSVMDIYISAIRQIPFFANLQPTFSSLTEYPQELGVLSLLGVCILFTYVYNIKRQNIMLRISYILALIIHILLLIRLPVVFVYILTISICIIHCIIIIRNISNEDKAKLALSSIRITFIYAIIIIGLITVFIIRPFQENTQFPEYAQLAIPNLEKSLSIAKKSLKENPVLGVGSIQYAWEKFTPESVNQNELADFSFETLVNQPINSIVRYGWIIAGIMSVIVLWIVFSFLRMIFVQKTIPLEIYPLLIIVIAALFIPFTVVTLVSTILLLLIWSSIITTYFKPIFTISLDIAKIPASIASLLTFIIIVAIAAGAFISTKMIHIIRSQRYIVEASQNTISQNDRFDLINKARSISPQYMDYAQLSISSTIDTIGQDALNLASSQTDMQELDSTKQQDIQTRITDIQKTIDDYKGRFPGDSRVIRLQLKLYSLIDRYGGADEALYMNTVKRGKELQPNSPNWTLYEAQYYARQSQRSEELNTDLLDKSQALLDEIINTYPSFIDAYQTYYDVLAFNKDYIKQITILSQYYGFVTSKNMIANKDVVYSLAVAYQNNEQYSEAISIYTKLLDAFPQYTNVYFKLGEIYEAQNQKQEAIKQYKKVLELDSTASLAQDKLNKLEKSK
jgi:tetratricopeptide (TPR) repeat protein